MEIMILETDKRLGVKAGEVYKAKRYQYDPHEKYSLIERVPDGYDPGCNQYISSVATRIRGDWCRVGQSGAFEPIPVNELPVLESACVKVLRVKTTQAQRSVLTKMVMLPRPVTSNEVGAQIKTMQALKAKGLIQNVERFGEAGNIGQERTKIHWVLNNQGDN